MTLPNVSIHILAYRSKTSIRQCVASALSQVFHGSLSIRVREQAGDDEEFAILRALAETPSAQGRLILSRGTNIGFAAGHNTLIRDAVRQKSGATTDFILCLNADAMLRPNFLAESLPGFTNERVGAIQGKLFRWNIEKNTPVYGSSNIPVIDTTGLLPLKNRRILNRGQGEEDLGQYENVEAIFGPDGAAPLYRRTALEDIAIPYAVFRKEWSPEATTHSANRIEDSGRIREYFDEDFFLYKEDVDLAWRLQWRGWQTLYIPKAVALHARGSGNSAARNPIAILNERRKISPRAKYYSFSNQRLMQIKNETLPSLFKNLPSWAMKETAAWVVALLTEPKTLPALMRIVRLAPNMLRKRRWIMRHRETRAHPFSWFR